MGQVLTLMPLLNQTLIVADNNNGYLNAVNATSAPLYARAKANYDSKLIIWNQSQVDVRNAKEALDALEAYYKPNEAPVNAGDYNATIAKVLTNEGYGDPFYDGKRQQDFKKYGIPQSNLRKSNPDCESLTGEGWEYIYSDAGRETGGVFTKRHRKCQEFIVQKWLSSSQQRANFLKGIYNNALAAEKQAKINTEIAKSELDKAVAAEERASGQRIKEKETDPEYIKLKNESEKIRFEAEKQKRTSRNFLILGLGLVVLAGAYLIIRKN